MSGALATSRPAYAASDWAAIMDEYEVHYLVLNTSDDRELFEYYSAKPGWTVELVDSGSVLLSHTGLLAQSPTRRKPEAAIPAQVLPVG